MIIVAMVICFLRLIGRSIFVIVTQDVVGIPLVCSSLLAIVSLTILGRSGGCTPTLVYTLVEALFTTSYWLSVILVIDTNHICSQLGDSFCQKNDEVDALKDGSVRRIDLMWLIMVLPGVCFDFLFIWIFRTPVTVPRVSPAKIQDELPTTLESIKIKREGIGGVGLEFASPRFKEQTVKRVVSMQSLETETSSRDLSAVITGLNRPVAVKSMPRTRRREN